MITPYGHHYDTALTPYCTPQPSQDGTSPSRFLPKLHEEPGHGKPKGSLVDVAAQFFAKWTKPKRQDNPLMRMLTSPSLSSLTAQPSSPVHGEETRTVESRETPKVHSVPALENLTMPSGQSAAALDGMTMPTVQSAPALEGMTTPSAQSVPALEA
jgi:hypothetical protein